MSADLGLLIHEEPTPEDVESGDEYLELAKRTRGVEMLVKAHGMAAKNELSLEATKLKQSKRRSAALSVLDYRAALQLESKRKNTTGYHLMALNDRIEIDRIAQQGSILHLSCLNMPSWYFLLNMSTERAYLFYVFAFCGVFAEFVLRPAFVFAGTLLKRRKHAETTDKITSEVSLDLGTLKNFKAERTRKRQMAFDQLYDFVAMQTCLLATCAFSAVFTRDNNFTSATFECTPVEALPLGIIILRTAYVCALCCLSGIVTVMAKRDLPVFDIAMITKIPTISFVKTALFTVSLASSMLSMLFIVKANSGFGLCKRI
ncbi:hypothetical protein HDU97_007919 [Phlyctochytrium planicorne]|nr:hypothetical protein HDU97_007919 [Phlyctochytrium planicorne]